MSSINTIMISLWEIKENFVVPGSHSVEAKTPAAAVAGCAVLDRLVETSRNTMAYRLNMVAQALILINNRWYMNKFQGCR